MMNGAVDLKLIVRPGASRKDLPDYDSIAPDVGLGGETSQRKGFWSHPSVTGLKRMR